MMEVAIPGHEIHRESPPTVSVIIPAYKAGEFIGEALKSICDQTFVSHEAVVIDDGSPDSEELERALHRYPCAIQYIKQENRGAAAARNAGLCAARGEFVAFLDADDRWLPNFLEEQLAFLELSNADLVYSDALLFGESPMDGRTFMEVQPSRGAVTPESLLSVDVTVLTSAVLARKKSIFDVGLFDETIKRGHDFELWLRLAKNGVRFAYQDKVLAEHRIVESGLSGNTFSQLERTLAVLETIKTREELTPTEEAAYDLNYNRTLAELAVETGKERLLGKDFAGALQSFNEAKKLRQSWKLMLVSLGVRIAPEMLRRIYSRRMVPPRPEGDKNAIG